MSNAFPVYESCCPIHGTISFNEKEKQIIDHPFYQRLRHISQLGFANYVYTGATHSRFGHSLGVMHLAGKIFERIVTLERDWLVDIFTPDDIAYFSQIVRFAALLHDTGHPPFSHSCETVLPLKASLPLPTDWYTAFTEEEQATHEDFSIAIINALSHDSPPLLSITEAQDICALIDSSIEVSREMKQRCELDKGNDKNILPLLRHLISGEMDADRMDYLHRDSHYAGVNYGKFDMDHLIRSLSCVQTEEGIVLVLNHNALHAYEGFLFARLHMFLQVYLHKTLLPFDYYLQQALLEREIDFNITGTLENFLTARNDKLLSSLFEAQEKNWASRIVLRKTVKRLFQFEHYHLPELKQQVLKVLKQSNIEYLFLQSSNYLSMLSSEDQSSAPLLLKNETLGKTQYLPIQDVSLLLGQYRQTADVQYLYCEREDYPYACEILTPLIFG
ncbi:MAG: HD domain-containing protein [SAR324 cluster bacterium]|nr:HD domain-containing protein [SAR324 cluster bacterium]